MCSGVWITHCVDPTTHHTIVNPIGYEAEHNNESSSVVLVLDNGALGSVDCFDWSAGINNCLEPNSAVVPAGFLSVMGANMTPFNRNYVHTTYGGVYNTYS